MIALNRIELNYFNYNDTDGGGCDDEFLFLSNVCLDFTFGLPDCAFKLIVM